MALTTERIMTTFGVRVAIRVFDVFYFLMLATRS